MTDAEPKLRWSKFWWKDWQGDQGLRSCSVAARGLWMDLLCIAHEGDPYGHVTINGTAPTVKRLATISGIAEGAAKTLLEELREAGVFSVTEDGVIFSRRMVRDKAASGRGKDHGENGGNPEILRGAIPKSERARPYKKTDSPQKTARIFAKAAGLCYWCSGEFTDENPFHIDHLLPVCDGGTNDEDNLVPSCARCNHARARKGWSHPKDPRNKSDSNPYNDTDYDSDTNPYPTSDSKLEAEAEERDRGKKERSSLRSPRARDPDPDFEAFWRAYPRKVGKGAAAKAWLRAKTLSYPDTIIAAVTRHRFDHRERFIPHPATWLNQERWLDEQSTFDPVLRAAGLSEADYTDDTPDWLKLPGGSA